MDLQFKTHRDVPYGWILAVGDIFRALRSRHAAAGAGRPRPAATFVPQGSIYRQQ
jgi:hypothetical protein